ncbi:amino acid ABC transporter ATP-binding protein [Jatrophihabitans endophyticus]|uniref:amino acid ABC transporter ATP-binding protein n=1 Tax=Jatrophihabitans endophyticus TaxID=1206085 RepID=UPI0019EF444A|nr:amino acid ABC transporter ATP-binding protein [Jatrophihabitans endophyticus]MBE7187676.1 amino acid ABC transporter ATP-binding protein [Jatrophihabitans endophyticus]
MSSLVKAPPVLRVEGLRKAFGTTVVLDSLDLSAPEHTCTALIGASGSGKSTLLRCIDLLEVVDDGVVELDGRDITDPRVDANEVRTHIGIVFQAFNLFPHLRVIDNVTLALRRVHKVGSDEAEQRGLDMLDRVGLRDRAAARPDELSGGQQQRVAIARALVARPRLMLFDEITSALDPELVGEVLSLVRELREDGMTMLVATHEMGFAREVADQVCFLDGGRVLESGPPEQVLADPVEARTRQFLRRIIEARRL